MVWGPIQKEMIKAVAIALLVAIAGSILPFAALFIPIPHAYYRLKLGPRPGRLVSLAALAILGFLSGGIHLAYMGGFFLVGQLLGEGISRRYTVGRAMALAVGGPILIWTGLFLALAVSSGTGPTAYVTQAVTEFGQLILTAAAEAQLPLEVQAAYSDFVTEAQQILIQVYPALTVLTVILTAWITLMLTRVLLGRQGIAIYTDPPLALWRAPEPLVWGVILSIAAMFIPIPAIRGIGLNLTLVFSLIYFFQGLGITAYMLNRAQFPKGLRACLYVLIAIFYPLHLAVAGIGLFDTWLNLRRIGINATN